MMHRMCGKTKLPTVVSWSLLMNQMRQAATKGENWMFLWFAEWSCLMETLTRTLIEQINMLIIDV